LRYTRQLLVNLAILSPRAVCQIGIDVIRGEVAQIGRARVPINVALQ
jgi:hypothetical protein